MRHSTTLALTLTVSITFLLIGIITNQNSYSTNGFFFSENFNQIVLTLPLSTSWIIELYHHISQYQATYNLIVTSISAGLTFFYFIRCIQLLTPGAHLISKLLYAGFMVSAPIYSISVYHDLSLTIALALLVFATRQSIEAAERKEAKRVIIAVIIISLSMLLLPGLALLLIPLLLLSMSNLNRKIINKCIMLACLSALCIQGALTLNCQDWSINHYLESYNTLLGYPISNLFFTALVLINPHFSVALPLLIMLAKKTDLYLPEKKALLAGIILYLTWLNGLPHLSNFLLLPLWVTLLLLAFPAWDRFVVYGLYFFKKTTIIVLTVLFSVQVLATLLIHPW